MIFIKNVNKTDEVQNKKLNTFVVIVIEVTKLGYNLKIKRIEVNRNVIYI